jgi:hypothetical protein
MAKSHARAMKDLNAASVRGTGAPYVDDGTRRMSSQQLIKADEEDVGWGLQDEARDASHGRIHAEEVARRTRPGYDYGAGGRSVARMAKDVNLPVERKKR